MLFIQPPENIDWLAPYAYSIVLLGFFFALFRAFENWYASAYDKPLYRHYFVYKKLKPSQKDILEKNFPFYALLSAKEKKTFQHRVASFIANKEFISREGLVLNDHKKVLVAAVGCMLSFGRKNFNYSLIERVLIYPGQFYSTINKAQHIGEFNPKQRTLVLSWEDFEKGYQITNDNRNLGIHEFMHAMQLEAMKSRDLDSTRFSKQFQNILKRLTHQEVKDKLDETKYFRAYAFTNQFEFMAVLVEYFMESPNDFKEYFPKLYTYTRKLLNFRYAGY